MKQLGLADEDNRMAYSDSFAFTDVYQRMLTSIAEEKENSRFQIICSGYHEEYKGENHCAFNIAMALIEAKQFLSKNVSTDPNKWLWRNLHVNDYENLPWSKTLLRPFLHRTVGVSGN